MSLIYCPECGNQTSDQATSCNKCGYPISKLNFKQTQSNTNQATSSRTNDSNETDYYYQQEFEAIQKSNESYKGRWNWFAFLFTWIWCFAKGCYGYGILILITMGGLAFSRIKLFGMRGSELLPVWAILIAVLMGMKGTWIYYNVKVKKKQFPN